jgi:hypothetical protein
VRDSLLKSGHMLLLDAEAVIHRIVIEDAKQPTRTQLPEENAANALYDP